MLPSVFKVFIELLWEMYWMRFSFRVFNSIKMSREFETVCEIYI